MSHYNDAERLLARSPSAPAALVHAVLAVVDALEDAARRETVSTGDASAVLPDPDVFQKQVRDYAEQYGGGPRGAKWGEESNDQPHRGADAHWSVLQRERDAARARARDLQRELDDARVAVTHVRRELDDACRVRDEWQTRSRELRNERDALRAAISRAARLLVDRVDRANTVAASSPSAHPYVKLGPEDK